VSAIQDRFNERTSGQFVIGCYLWPHRVLALPAGAADDPYELTKVLWTFSAQHGADVLLTADGGLFTEPPDGYQPPDGARTRVSVQPNDTQFRYSERTAERFNAVICELALANLVPQPAGPLHISPAWLLADGYAMITSSGRGAHQANHRGSEAIRRLRTPDPAWHSMAQTEVRRVPDIRSLTSLPNAARLTEVHVQAPTYVANSYYFWFQQQFAEAVVNSWIFVEQYLEHLWKSLIPAVGSHRRERLKDSRTYTASVRTEVLQTAGLLDDATAEVFHRARRFRNSLSHNARPVEYAGGKAAIEALEAVLLLVCGPGSRPQELNLSVRW
jgi:hypothetical protein